MLNYHSKTGEVFRKPGITMVTFLGQELPVTLFTPALNRLLFQAPVI
jgi:hypothetical protein